MRLAIAAVHEPGCGTKRTNRAGRWMSVDRGKAEVAFRARQGSPRETSAVRRATSRLVTQLLLICLSAENARSN
jgi:hypothetical protein